MFQQMKYDLNIHGRNTMERPPFSRLKSLVCGGKSSSIMADIDCEWGENFPHP